LVPHGVDVAPHPADDVRHRAQVGDPRRHLTGVGHACFQIALEVQVGDPPNGNNAIVEAPNADLNPPPSTPSTTSASTPASAAFSAPFSDPPR